MYIIAVATIDLAIGYWPLFRLSSGLTFHTVHRASSVLSDLTASTRPLSVVGLAPPCLTGGCHLYRRPSIRCREFSGRSSDLEFLVAVTIGWGNSVTLLTSAASEFVKALLKDSVVLRLRKGAHYRKPFF